MNLYCDPVRWFDYLLLQNK